jgi:hypothetical protein
LEQAKLSSNSAVWQGKFQRGDIGNDLGKLYV